MNDKDLGKIYQEILETNNSKHQQELISKLSIDQFVGYLQYKYGNENIKYEEASGGKYVITDGDRYVLEFKKEDSLGNVYETISNNDEIKRELSNKGVYEEKDINKLDTITKGMTSKENYTVNIDVTLFEEIYQKYEEIHTKLLEIKKYIRNDILTGELSNYYQIITSEGSPKKIIEEMILEYEDIKLKMEGSLDTYKKIDDDLKFLFNSAVLEIFSIDTTAVTMQGSTYEERRAYVENFIVNLERTIEEFEDTYEELYADGIPAEKEKAVSFVNLLSSLGLFNETAMFGLGDIQEYSSGKSDKILLYNVETGCFNIRQLGFVLKYCEENNVLPTLRSYIVDGKNWCESGMNDMFGKKLLLSEAEVINMPVEQFQNIKASDDSPYNGWSLVDYNGNIMFDAECIFISNYVNSYLFGQGDSEINFYNEIGNITDGDGEHILRESFGMGKWGWGTSFYDEIPEENKAYASTVIRQHIKNNNIFDMFKNDENTKNIYEMYNETVRLQNDINITKSLLYKYKQYYKLMPFEEKRKESGFKDYITKDYSGYNQVLFDSFEYKGWLNYLDRSEVALYDYLLETEGEDTAKGYLNALKDIVNQRKGYSEAVKFASDLNEIDRIDNESYDMFMETGSGDPNAMFVPTLMKFISDYFPEFYDNTADTATSTVTGFVDGINNFFDGFYDLIYADGVVSAKDYELMYKMQLLATDNEYTTNLSNEEKEWLTGVYQFGNSIGYMTVPTLLSYVPVVGQALSTTTLFLSSTGNNTEDLVQQGVNTSDAYLYGSLMGLSEVGIEMLFGGLPGGADKAGAKGILPLIKSTYSEANEEFFQTYVSAGLTSCATGEPVDLTETTAEAFQAASMAIYTSAAMNAGGKAFIKVADVVIEVSPSEYNSYNEWRLATETKYRESHPYLAGLLMGSDNKVAKTITTEDGKIDVLDVNREDIPNLSENQKKLISGITYNSETELYTVHLMSGMEFNVTNLSDITSMDITKNSKPLIDIGVEKLNEILSITKDSMKTLGGKVQGLSSDAMVKYDEVISLLKEKYREIKYSSDLKTPLDQIDFSNMNTEDIVYILNNNTAGGTLVTNPSLSHITELAISDVELAMVCVNNGMYDFLYFANKDVLLEVLPVAWKNGYDRYPNLASSDMEIAKMCADNGVYDFLAFANSDIVLKFLPAAYKDGYSGLPNHVGSNVEIAKLWLSNIQNFGDTSIYEVCNILDYVLSIEPNFEMNITNLSDSSKLVVIQSYLNAGNYELAIKNISLLNSNVDLASLDHIDKLINNLYMLELAKSNVSVASFYISKGQYGFLNDANKEVLLKFLPDACKNGYSEIPNLVYTDIEMARLWLNNNLHNEKESLAVLKGVLRYDPNFEMNLANLSEPSKLSAIEIYLTNGKYDYALKNIDLLGESTELSVLILHHFDKLKTNPQMLELAKSKYSVALVYVTCKEFSFLDDANKDILLKFLPEACNNGYEGYPKNMFSDIEIAKLWVNHVDRSGYEKSEVLSYILSIEPNFEMDISTLDNADYFIIQSYLNVGNYDFVAKLISSKDKNTIINYDKDVLLKILPKSYEYGYKGYPQLACTDIEIAEICVDNGVYDFLVDANRDVLLKFLSKAYKDGYNGYPQLASTDIEIAEICINNDMYDFILDANKVVLLEFLPGLYEKFKGYDVSSPTLAESDVDIAQICINNMVYDFLVDANKDVLLKVLPKAYEYGYRGYPRLASTDIEIAQVCADNGVYDFLDDASKEILIKFLPEAHKNGFNRYSQRALSDYEYAQIFIDNGIYTFFSDAYLFVEEKCLKFNGNNMEFAKYIVENYDILGYMLQSFSKDTLTEVLPIYYEKNSSSKMIPMLAYADPKIMDIVKRYYPEVMDDAITQKITDTIGWIKNPNGLEKKMKDYFGSLINEQDIFNAVHDIYLEDDNVFLSRPRINFDTLGYNNSTDNTAHIRVNETTFDVNSTVIHEEIHAIFRDKITGITGLMFNEKYRGINEAATELFTQQTMGSEYIAPEKIEYYKATKQLKAILEMGIPGLDLESFKLAYITHDDDSIRIAIDAIAGDGYYENNLIPAFYESTEKGKNDNLENLVEALKIKVDSSK